MLGDQIEEERKMRLARYDTDLRNESKTHSVNEQTRGLNDQAVNLQNINKGTWEDIPVLDEQGQPTGEVYEQRHRDTGERKAVSGVAATMAIDEKRGTIAEDAQNDAQTHDVEMQGTRLTAVEKQAGYDRFWRAYQQRNRINHQTLEGDKNRTQRTKIADQTMGLDFYKTLAGSASEELKSIQESLQFASSDEDRAALTERYENARSNWNDMTGRAMAQFSLDEVSSFASPPSSLSPDEEIDEPREQGNANPPGGSVEAPSGPMLSTAVRARAASQNMSKEDLRESEKLAKQIKALTTNLPRAVGGGRKADIEKRLDEKQRALAALYKRYGIETGENFYGAK
jgi:hypothetical protein